LTKKSNFSGEFSFGNNSLFYIPSSKDTDKIPHKIKAKGKWSLDVNRNLIFIVDKSQNDIFGNSITFLTKIENVSKDYLSFSLLKRKTPAFKKITRIYLKGRWHTNRFNQIVFSLKRDKEIDGIVFKDMWSVNKNNQITYVYRRKYTSKTVYDSFTLKGQWGIKNSRLIFYVENSKKSFLSFGLSFKKFLVNPKNNKLEFLINIKKRKKIISLSGKWRLSSLGVEFVTSFGRKRRSWQFRLDKKLSRGREASLFLIDTRGRNLGYRVVFKKKAFKSGQFVFTGIWSKEKRIETGIK